MGHAYRDWCLWKGFEYKPKWYEEEEQQLPYIPTEQELDQLIAGCNSKYACFLQLLKESGFRPFEALSLTADSIDIERRVVTLNTPAKRSKPRQFRMSSRLASMISPFVKSEGRLWNQDVDDMHRTFSNQRKVLALKLGNPKLKKISFKTFRHWKATMEYHRTKDILYVKELLGHKSLKNTLVYTHLVSFEEENAFIVKVANNLTEFTSLLESGFEYVSDYEGMKILTEEKVNTK